VAQQFLDRTNVAAVGQQVRGKRVAKRVAGDAFGQSGPAHGLSDRPLHQGFVDVMTPLIARVRIAPPALACRRTSPVASGAVEWLWS